jgi:hypothetical protein
VTERVFSFEVGRVLRLVRRGGGRLFDPPEYTSSVLRNEDPSGYIERALRERGVRCVRLDLGPLVERADRAPGEVPGGVASPRPINIWKYPKG